MKVISGCKTRFFLTGGTALSRAYLRHRYSDDLDFFVNNDGEYSKQLNIVLTNLHKYGNNNPRFV
ncbi:MAG: nucleotidyl transferase AbiEii/AbiGii toxin family protein [Elusimicrobiota bacterium]|nr:nucleotidyl transferase AbiEii/AbiGii toxin family protein [Elusimicrobiota bacterium]